MAKSDQFDKKIRQHYNCLGDSGIHEKWQPGAWHAPGQSCSD